MDDSATFFSGDSFAQELGIRLISSSPGSATLDLPITSKHLNGHGTVHGGVIFSLADAAFGVASNNGGVDAVAINTSMNYMKAATTGVLRAVATEFSKNHRLGSYVVEVFDQDGEKIALFQGLAYRRKPRTEP